MTSEETRMATKGIRSKAYDIVRAYDAAIEDAKRELAKGLGNLEAETWKERDPKAAMVMKQLRSCLAAVESLSGRNKGIANEVSELRIFDAVHAMEALLD